MKSRIKFLLVLVLVISLAMGVVVLAKNVDLTPSSLGIDYNTANDLNKSMKLLSLSESDENAIVSSVSLDIGLAMCANGAKGDTLMSLEEYLGYSIDDYNKLSKTWSGTLDDGVVLANTVYVSDKIKLLGSYTRQLSKYFKVKPKSKDLTSQSIVSEINKWVKSNTNNMIPELITEPFSEETRLALLNAISFDKKWEDKKWETDEDRVFTNIDDSESFVKYLYKDTSGDYWANDDFMAFSRYYKGGRFTFIGVLPEDESLLADCNIADLDLGSLLSDENKKYSDDLRVSMPCFDFEVTYDKIADFLRDSGIDYVFDDGVSDFSGISVSPEADNLYIKNIIQKAKIELDEEGTKAAVVTAVVMENGIGFSLDEEIHSPVIIRLTRPFLFVIMDTKYNVPLFVGKVVKL